MRKIFFVGGTASSTPRSGRVSWRNKIYQAIFQRKPLIGVKYQPKRPKLKPTNLVLLINDFLHTLAHIIRTENCFENCWLATCTDFVWINIIDYNDVLQDTTYSHVSDNRVELRILLVGNLQLASKYVVVEVCRFYPFLMTQFKIKLPQIFAFY